MSHRWMTGARRVSYWSSQAIYTVLTKMERRPTRKRKPDLPVLVAIWEFLSVFVALMGISAITGFAFPHAWRLERFPDVGAIFGLSIGVFVLLYYVGIALAAAIGILRANGWIKVVKDAIRSVAPIFCSRQMLKECIKTTYASAVKTQRNGGTDH